MPLLKLQGNLGIQYQNENFIKISIEFIKFYGNGSSGSLKLRLISSDEQKINVIHHNDLIAEHYLIKLKKNQYYNSLNLKLPVLNKPKKQYLLLLLEEYQHINDYVIVDYCNFAKKKNFFHQQRILYHGTTKQNAEKIKRSTLRPSSLGRLGPGIYFTQNKYEAAKIGNRFNKPGAVIQCKVKGYWKTDKHPDWAGIGYNFKEYCVPNNKFVKILNIYDA